MIVGLGYDRKVVVTKGKPGLGEGIMIVVGATIVGRATIVGKSATTCNPQDRTATVVG